LTPEDLKFYDEDLNYDWEAGEFDIMIGTSSADVQKNALIGKNKQNENIFCKIKTNNCFIGFDFGINKLC
jgi:hypothetical protein